MLTTPPDVLSPRMVRIVEDLAGDWRRLDERVERLSDEIEAIRAPGCQLRAADERAGVGPIISSAMVDRRGGCVQQGPRLRRLAGARAKGDLDRGPYHPRQDIQAWQSLPAMPASIPIRHRGTLASQAAIRPRAIFSRKTIAARLLLSSGRIIKRQPCCRTASNINGLGLIRFFFGTGTSVTNTPIETAGWGCHDRAHQSSPSELQILGRRS
jgi:hypothetical protein